MSTLHDIIKLERALRIDYGRRAIRLECQIDEMRAAIEKALILDNCRETSCPSPARAMCGSEAHQALRKALTSDGTAVGKVLEAAKGIIIKDQDNEYFLVKKYQIKALEEALSHLLRGGK